MQKFIGVASPNAKSQRDYDQRDYEDGDDARDSPFSGRDGNEDYDDYEEYDEEYYENYDYKSEPDTFGKFENRNCFCILHQTYNQNYQRQKKINPNHDYFSSRSPKPTGQLH